MAFTAKERKRRLGRGAGAKIARRLKRDPGHVSRVLAGDRFDRDVIAAACQIAHLPREVLFPEFAARFSSSLHKAA